MKPYLPALSAVVLCVASSAAWADGDPLQPAAVTDPKTGIQMRVPVGWSPKKGIADTGYEAPAKDRTPAGGLAASVILAQAAAPGIKPADAAALARSKRAQYAKLFPGYQDLPAAGAVPAAAGRGVGVVEFTYRVKNVLPVHSRQIWVVGDGKVYCLTFTSLADAFPGHAVLFDAMTRSMVLP